MRWLLPLLLLCPFPLTAGEWSLHPAAVDGGGVALLRWEGPDPSLAVARFNDRLVYLTPTDGGAAALLGTDLELPAGDYPLSAAAVDRRGETSRYSAVLTVRAVERPEERLSLPPAQVAPADPKVLARIAREGAMLRELFARQRPLERWEPFALPVAQPVSSPFGLRRVLNGRPRSPHAGIDFRTPLGTPVRAAAGGVAAFAGDLYYTGRTVVLDHGEGLYTLYAHLSELRCREGEAVAAGAVLGLAGSSGRSTGPHLHWGGKLRGDRIDPRALVELLGAEKP